jgi:polyhydroxyalkanoate synthesis regulator phasin
LKHEIAKRERQISANRADISDLRERYRQREQDWEEDYAAAQSSRYMRENFESTYYQKGMETLQGEIDGARESMRELQEEITALEMVMESKLT